MELKIRKSGDSYIIDVAGEMDLYNSYRLKDLVLKMLEKRVERFMASSTSEPRGVAAAAASAAGTGVASWAGGKARGCTRTSRRQPSKGETLLSRMPRPVRPGPSGAATSSPEVSSAPFTK